MYDYWVRTYHTQKLRQNHEVNVNILQIIQEIL